MRTDCLADRTATTSGPRKPLYLTGGGELWVALDGPALRVKHSARAAQWYPLVRLTRVVSARTVRWDSQALLACAAVGIPVVFVDRRGQVQGLLVGSVPPEQDLFWRLCERANHPVGQQCYSAWRKTMEQHALSVLQQTQLALVGLNATQARRQLAEEKHRYASCTQCAAIERHLAGLVTALSAELLGDIGLNATRLALLNNGLHCLDDLAELLGWALEFPVLNALQAHAEGKATFALEDKRQWVGLFEAQVSDLRRLGQQLLTCLDQALMD
ncbi:MAG: CRISPR-associated endonuclease Cas1 [Candidatus Competibacteraceae bacterium]